MPVTTAIGDFFKKFKDSKGFSLIQNNSITTRNIFIAAGTYGLERLLNAKTFKCPEKRHELYGFTFLFAPVIVLFCVNVLVIGEVWKLSSRICVSRYRRHGECEARVCPILLRACVGPAVWLIVAFLEEDYYICAVLGPVRPRRSELEDVEWRHKVEECKSMSCILAWAVLVVLVVVGASLITCKKCYLKDNLVIPNHYVYERREALGAMKAFTEFMSPGAKFKYENADLDEDPETAEYGGEEEKVKYYKNGIPEIIGRKTVEKLFEGSKDWQFMNKWHYMDAYTAFKTMYPRIATGTPFDPWRAVEGDNNGYQRISSGENKMELKPLYLELADTSE